MLVIGLTGGIATGKSTASAHLASLNVPVLDLDLYAREVVRPGSRGLRQIISHFGSSVVQADGTLDRKALGTIIFRSEKERAILNAITHPLIRRKMYWTLFKLWISGEKFAVIDSPLLIETGFYKWVAEVVLISCSETTQLQRLMRRDDSSEADARIRLDSQMSIDKKRAFADIVVNNDSDTAQLSTQINAIVRVWRIETSGWTTALGRFLPIVSLLSAVEIWYRRTGTKSR